MSDDASPSEAENKPSESSLDLSGLGGLSLGPDWGTGSIPPSKMPKSRGRDREDRPGTRSGFGSGSRGEGGPPRRDRRAGKTARRSGGFDGPPSDEGGRGRGGPPQGGRRFQRGRREEEPQFNPIVKADFYPDDAAFKALTQAIKHSCRTFELFEIARLILEKPERWVCVARHPDQKEGEPAILHASVPDGLPFVSEQEALNHVFNHYLSEFFEIEEFEAEPPSGSFQMIHRCGMTGELIGPPNFHRYQAMLREHHAAKLPHVPFEKVQGRLESVREQEVIDAWLEQMKKGYRYTLKQAEGSDPIVMQDFESARLYLLTHAKEKLVRPAYSVRFLGKDLHLLGKGDLLRRSIEALYQRQLRFPLETANNLRGRLRRLHLAVYKRGSKGVSYVCAVKRRFREPNEVLAENLSDLIAFLEAHPNIRATDLPREYLGLKEEKPAEAPAPAATETPTAESEEATPAAEVPAPPAEPAESEALNALKRDLRYLVSQGYVVEFSDGRLQVPPAREEPSPKEEEKDQDKGPASPAKAESQEAPSEEAKTETAAAVTEASAPAPVEDAPTPEASAEPTPSESAPVVEEAAPTEEATPAPETTPAPEASEPEPAPEPTPPEPTAESAPRMVEPVVPDAEPTVVPTVEDEAPKSETPIVPIAPTGESEPIAAEPPPVEESSEPAAESSSEPTEPGAVRPRGESDPA